MQHTTTYYIGKTGPEVELIGMPESYLDIGAFTNAMAHRADYLKMLAGMGYTINRAGEVVPLPNYYKAEDGTLRQTVPDAA